MRKWSWTDSVAGLFIRTDDGSVFFQIQDGNYELARFIADACNEKERDAAGLIDVEGIDPRRVSFVKYADGSEDWHVAPRGQTGDGP